MVKLMSQKSLPPPLTNAHEILQFKTRSVSTGATNATKSNPENNAQRCIPKRYLLVSAECSIHPSSQLKQSHKNSPDHGKKTFQFNHPPTQPHPHRNPRGSLQPSCSAICGILPPAPHGPVSASRVGEPVSV